MKKELFIFLIAFTFLFPCFAVDVNSWNSDSSVTDKSAVKEISLDLSETGMKKAVVGFSTVDVSLEENQDLGAFATIDTNNILDKIELEIDLSSGEAFYYNSEGTPFFVFYQFVGNEDLSVYLTTDQKLTGASFNDKIDFKVYRNSSDGERIYINTSSDDPVDIGQSSLSEENRIYNHPSNDRYAWADGLALNIETINADLLNKKADSYSASLYVTVRSEG